MWECITHIIKDAVIDLGIALSVYGCCKGCEGLYNTLDRP